MSILIVAEMREGEVRHATYAAVAAGKELAGHLGVDYDIVVLDRGAQSGADKLKDFGAKTVYWSAADAVADYTAEAYAKVISGLAQEKGHTGVLAASTTLGKDLLPRVAALLDAGMVSDAIGFRKEGEGVVYVRPMYAGNAEALVVIETPVHVLSVREASFDAAAPGGNPAQVVELPVELDPSEVKARFVEYQLSKSERPELTEAKVIVSVGRGVKDAEGLKVIEQLADLLGAAVGASRAVVDEGLLPNDLQVGQTGKIVAPELYFACGISGAIQHVAGIKDAKVIVAINKDEEAPIFEVADYGLVDDLHKAVPKLIEKVREARA